MRIHLDQSEPRVVWRGRDNPALALCFSGSHALRATATRSSPTRRSSSSIPPPIAAGDVVGIGIHTGNALRGYEVGQLARRARRVGRVWRHSRHALPRGGHRPSAGPTRSSKATATSPGATPSTAASTAAARKCTKAGRSTPDHFLKARWDLLPPDRYMWASVQTVRGCPKHCSFCSVWKTDGQEPRQRGVDAVLRRRSWSCGASDSASSRSQTTTSTPSRSRISSRPHGVPIIIA